ncbi:MAG: HAD hydrolase-like protein, partial [Clostridia bacterium]|nr:HAD hydrolase-like protein [Clostridia bacterium]
MNYTTILFDLDGTILDTGEDLQHSLNHVLEKYGLPPRSLAETCRFLGNGIRRLIELGAGEGVSADTLDAMFSDFKAYYRLHCLDRTRPYEGIVPLLTSLREAGAKTAVVSNKADFAVQSLAERFFPGLFDFAVG